MDGDNEIQSRVERETNNMENTASGEGGLEDTEEDDDDSEYVRSGGSSDDSDGSSQCISEDGSSQDTSEDEQSVGCKANESCTEDDPLQASTDNRVKDTTDQVSSSYEIENNSTGTVQTRSPGAINHVPPVIPEQIPPVRKSSEEIETIVSDFGLDMQELHTELSELTEKFHPFREYMDAYERYSVVLAASFKATYFKEHVHPISENDEMDLYEEDENVYQGETTKSENRIQSTRYEPTDGETNTYNEQQLIFDMLRLDAKSMVNGVNTLRTHVESIDDIYEEFGIQVPIDWVRDMDDMFHGIEESCYDLLRRVDNRKEYQTMMEHFYEQANKHSVERANRLAEIRYIRTKLDRNERYTRYDRRQNAFCSGKPLTSEENNNGKNPTNNQIRYNVDTTDEDENDKTYSQRREKKALARGNATQLERAKDKDDAHTLNAADEIQFEEFNKNYQEWARTHRAYSARKLHEYWEKNRFGSGIKPIEQDFLAEIYYNRDIPRRENREIGPRPKPVRKLGVSQPVSQLEAYKRMINKKRALTIDKIRHSAISSSRSQARSEPKLPLPDIARVKNVDDSGQTMVSNVERIAHLRRSLLTHLSGDSMADSVNSEGLGSTYLKESGANLGDSRTNGLKDNTAKARKRQQLPHVGQQVKKSKTWVQEKRTKLLDSISSFERKIRGLEAAKHTDKIRKLISKNKKNLGSTHRTLRAFDNEFATSIDLSTDVGKQEIDNAEDVALMERTRLPLLGEDADILQSIVGQARNNLDVLQANTEPKRSKSWFDLTRGKLHKSIEKLKKITRRPSFDDDSVETRMRTEKNKEALQGTLLTLRCLENDYPQYHE